MRADLEFLSREQFAVIIWLYRQIQAVRKAIAGRDHPEQLAWAMALGVLLGVVPKGNLVTIVLVAVVLSLRINHAMAAVTAVAVSFAAVMLDPFTHQLGQWVLEQPTLQGFFTWSWQQPLVPWTDLNNTVVMGSLLFGLITLFPTYSLSLPVFRALSKNSGGDADGKREHDSQQSMKIEPVPAAAMQSAGTDHLPQSARPRIDVIRIHRQEEIVAVSVVDDGSANQGGNGSKIIKQEKAA